MERVPSTVSFCEDRALHASAYLIITRKYVFMSPVSLVFHTKLTVRLISKIGQFSGLNTLNLIHIQMASRNKHARGPAQHFVCYIYDVPLEKEEIH